MVQYQRRKLASANFAKDFRKKDGAASSDILAGCKEKRLPWDMVRL